MVLHFNVKGESRKAMVTAIEKEIGGKARYLGVPSCAYEIGNYTVGRNGELEFGDFDDIDEVAPIVDACIMATGITPAEWEESKDAEETETEGAMELTVTTARQNGWMSANDIRELENLDRIPAELGGDLYLINGNMTKLEDAGIFADSAQKEEEDSDEEQEVLELEEQENAQPGNKRGNRRKSSQP